jgi:prophage maintenance system killer protein
VSASLQAADLRFINRVAAKRFAGGEPDQLDGDTLEAAITGAAAGTAFVRAASLAAALLRSGAFPVAPLQTVLLVLHCALSLEGFSLIAPQGVLAGMIRGLAADDDAAVMARWLEDRAVPSGSG